MQNLSRNRDQPDPRSFAARKGHLPQLSISDDNHHVTEAIGYMYGDDDSPSSPQSSTRYSIRSDRSLEGDSDMSTHRNSLPRRPIAEQKASINERVLPSADNHKRSLKDRMDGKDGSPDSPIGAREQLPSETANSHFPLNDIDYESSPAAVAQELSNLQALRRMSMDVAATGDPDLPQLSAAGMPSAPSSATSEDDSARLFWVPARLHPELAPKEFKSFLESKAEQIKRRSGELSTFSSPIASRSSSLSSDDGSGGLQRKKSKLSKQINNPVGYQDGAERLEKKRSLRQQGQGPDPNLQELESLVSDESGVARLSLDNKTDDEDGDVILPSIPGSSLKRSTRTKYSRPSSQKGPSDRGGTYAERAKRRAGVGGQSPATSAPPNASLSSDTPLAGFSTDVSNLASTLKTSSFADPVKPAPNFSRPAGSSSSTAASNGPSGLLPSTQDSVSIQNEESPGTNTQNLGHKTRRGAPTVSLVNDRPIPHIIESPPPEDHPVRTSSMAPPPTAYSVKAESPKQPESVSSRDQRSKQPLLAQRPSISSKQSNSSASSIRPGSRGSAVPPQTHPSQGLDQPSPLPGQDTNTSNLSIIPTLTVDRRQEQRKKEEKKSSWSWLLGKEDQDREKDKSKSKSSKTSQTHDNTRLDVLQTSIDGASKGRESLVLDRESLKLEEERKKESQRKSSGSEKKEKESIFSSIFGGKKNRAEKESQKRAQERLSPEPPFRELKPDIDYNWTRFSILEERAIYRMAHIKLANPRRALYSQVLLSNFMYSYLAKVQQMHPQMNLPTSAKQQRKQKEQQQQQQQQQPEELLQYQRYQQHQAQQDQQAAAAAAAAGAAAQGSQNNQIPGQSLDGDSSMYDYNYSRGGQRPDSRASKHSVESSAFGGSEHYSGNGGNHQTVGAGNAPYHQQPHQQQYSYQQRHHGAEGYRYDDDDDDDDDMW